MKPWLLLIVIALTGCTTLDKTILDEEVEAKEYVFEDLDTGTMITNVVYTTNYVVKPEFGEAVQIVDGVPVWGIVLSTILTGLAGVYASARNKQKGKALAEALILANEAGREILLGLPNGDTIDDEFKAALIRKQMAMGKVDEITKLVQTVARPIKRRPQ